jgi:hypothetical protein
MRIGGMYHFNDSDKVINATYAPELAEITAVITSVNAADYMTKVSKEKTMAGRMLYSPVALNRAFKAAFSKLGWKNVRVKSEYTTQYYIDEYKPAASTRGAFRDMDFVKNKLGVEVQFGKYSFMVYNVAAKMTIFRNLKIINAGIEIVPVKELADRMSTGVSYFEQFLWDLENRGISNIDTPVLILGIAP